MIEPNSTDSRPRLSPSTPQSDAAEQHAGHLHVEQQHARREELVLRHADAPQARHADDAEEDEVVDVDEVAERGHE